MPVVGRQHPVQPRRRPDTEIDDAGAAADQRGTVGPVAPVQPPPDRADDDARSAPPMQRMTGEIQPRSKESLSR